jgi:uncharacterized membrane protein
MIPRDLVNFACALGCGLLAGFFFAFSVCVMKALGKLPPAHGIAAMQSINVVVINRVFLSAFLGTAVLCGIAVILSLVAWQTPAGPYALAGGVLYVAGTFLVTMLCNVPRNNALAALAPTSPEAASLWAAYLSSWTAWNHVRMVAALAASASFTLALYLRR